jgi:glycosyl hydrolase family 26
MRRVWLLVFLVLIGMLPVHGGTASATGFLEWGASATKRTGETDIQAVERTEAQVGRPLAVVRVFLTWNSTFPNAYHRWLRDSGHTILLSVKPQRSGGVKIPWRDIADAPAGSALDAEIVAWANRVASFGGPVTFTLNHEPEAEASVDYGTDADFKDAWRRVITTFRDQRVPNASYVWIMTAYSFGVPLSDRRRAEKWYPGDDFVDGIGADAYNWYTCRPGINTPWRSLAAIIEPMRVFGTQHSTKQLWLTEWASTEDPQAPTRKAEWITAARDLFLDPIYAQFVGLSYFNTPGSKSWNCVWPIDSSPEALTAFTDMGLDPFYSG